jgi:hypothetical protein
VARNPAIAGQIDKRCMDTLARTIETPSACVGTIDIGMSRIVEATSTIFFTVIYRNI